MKILNVNLKKLVQMFEMEPKRKYAVVVIDNAPPLQPQLPLIGKSFIWIAKVGFIPTGRSELERLFQSYGIQVEQDQPIAVFHHHDFSEPYLRFKEKVECYEFSHTDSIAYRAFCHADANLLSHMLGGTFRKYDKVILAKVGLPKDEIEELRRKHWFFKELKKLKGVGEEESMIYATALEFTGGKIVPDPRRYRPEVHDQLIKAGVPTDQYAIPAMFKEVEIQTGTKLDEEVAKRMLEKKMDWQKEIERLKKERAREKELRERGELLPKDATEYIDSIAPSLGYDYTAQPVYPPTRKDIAAVKRSVENGSSYGYDIIYLVWRVGNTIKAKKLIDSASTKDYIFIRSVTETESGIKIEVESGGSYSGSGWDKSLEIPFAELSEGEAESPRNKFQRLSLGIAGQIDSLPDAAKPYMEVMAEQMARLGMATSGRKTKGEERLELEYSDLLEKLKKKHPNLSEVFRLAVIAEVYDDKLIRETFALLEMTDDDRIVNETLHILGEMAMMRNNPSLYLRLINLLKKFKKAEQSKILSDSRLEFQTDEIVESALKDYESLLV